MMDTFLRRFHTKDNEKNEKIVTKLADMLISKTTNGMEKTKDLNVRL